MKSNPIQHVVDPYVVGGAIIGLKCKGGIVIGADTLLSYGGLLSNLFIYARVPGCQPVRENNRSNNNRGIGLVCWFPGGNTKTQGPDQWIIAAQW